MEKIDITEQSRLLNQDKLKDFGRDGMTYKPETSFTNADYWAKHEGNFAHGYPATQWL